jgi:hypothetical protein
MTTPISLSTVTSEHLLPLVGATFAITLPSGHVTEGVLETVTPLPTYPAAKRPPFSFVLLVPNEAGRPEQGILRLEHASLGALEVFAVPIGPKGTSMRWEIVFN